MTNEMTINVNQMLSYLQAKLTKFQTELEKYGMEDRMVQRRLEEMISCKEMVECLIQMPVNLQQDGKVTVGF